MTVLGQSGRSRGFKLDCPKDLKWTVLKSKSGRSDRNWKLVTTCVGDKFGMLVTSQVTNKGEIRITVK